MEPERGKLRPAKTVGRSLGEHGSRGGVAFTAPPSIDGGASRRTLRRLAIAGAAAAGIVTVALVVTQFEARDDSSAAAPPAAEASVSPSLLQLGPTELDLKATQLARAMLADGTAPAVKEPQQEALTALSETRIAASGVAPASAGEPVAAPAGPASQSAAERARHTLERLPPAARTALATGDTALFTIRIIDSVAEDGDRVSLALNGVRYGVLELNHPGWTLTVAAPVNAEALLEITAVDDGGGGVTFGATGADGVLRSRVMSVGESETWRLRYGGR